MLRDADPVQRGVAALALRDLGAAAAPALPDLERALADDEVGVRMRSADANAGLGVAALPALDALIAAARAPGQHVHVLRSVAIALGGIGPGAAKALPALAEIAKIPRVGPTAVTAMRKIRGQ